MSLYQQLLDGTQQLLSIYCRRAKMFFLWATTEMLIQHWLMNFPLLDSVSDIPSLETSYQDPRITEWAVQCSSLILFFRPVEAYNAAEGGIDGILEGLLKDQTAKYDTHFAHTLQNRLFEFKLSDGSVIAVDLAATNINRGRDHGINPYNLYREQCGLPRAKSFEELSDTISPEQIQQLQRIYAHVDDIDLYIGGLSETPVTGAVVGPTFGCIIGKQFSALKKGDRFFYENGSGSQAFTLPQLAEIKKITFSKLICDNTDIRMIQPNVFLQATEEIKNSQVSCESLTGMDLQAWISQI